MGGWPSDAGMKIKAKPTTPCVIATAAQRMQAAKADQRRRMQRSRRSACAELVHKALRAVDRANAESSRSPGTQPG
jgi:hypothetical protein